LDKNLEGISKWSAVIYGETSWVKQWQGLNLLAIFIKKFGEIEAGVEKKSPPKQGIKDFIVVSLSVAHEY